MVQELSEILSKGSTHIVKDPLKSKFVLLVLRWCHLTTHCVQADLTKTGFEKASLEIALMLSYNFQWPQHAAEVCPGLLNSATPAAPPPPFLFPPLHSPPCLSQVPAALLLSLAIGWPSAGSLWRCSLARSL